MVGNILVPLGRCEHGPAGKLPQIRPPHTNCRVEDHADRLSITWFGSPQADARNLRVSHLVAPPGSTVDKPMAAEGVMTQRFHGGGPADGALNGAVKAPSLTLAGQPCVL